MARKVDKTSARYLAPLFLDERVGEPRSELLDKLMVEFEVGLVYAKTLYQLWRKQSKVTGTLTKVFAIRDHKDGQTVDPYVFTKHVPNPSGQATTEAKAVQQYIKELKSREEKAKKIC